MYWEINGCLYYIEFLDSSADDVNEEQIIPSYPIDGAMGSSG